MAQAKKVPAKTRKPAAKAPVVKKTQSSGPSTLSRIRENFNKSYKANPTGYTIGLIVALLVIGLGLLFWFNRSWFLAANINGRLVTTPEFYNRLAKTEGQNVLDAMVREVLIKQEAEKSGITVSQEEIDTQIAEIEKRLGGREAFESALSQSQTDRAQLAKQIELQVMVEKLLGDQINVTDEEIAKYKEENKETIADQSDEEIRESMKANKINELFPSWFDNLKKNATITKYF
jgi:hypothetical protein